MIQHLLKLSIISVVVSGCTFLLPENIKSDQVSCATDIFICEDGTALSRTGAECSFPVCPAITPEQFTRFMTEDIPLVHEAFEFSATIPQTWRVEAVPEIDSISLYNPAAPGESTLDKSQIFIRYFESETFLTLPTVVVFSNTATTKAGHPAKIYDIKKQDSVSDFQHQPRWRNERHVVTDIQVNDDDPSLFYVVAQRPGLSQDIVDTFIDSLVFDMNHVVQIELPIDEFYERIAIKPFGILIDPESPLVENERFNGYHTGVDVEYSDVDGDVPVRAIADGEVMVSRFVSGYGGVVVIKHEFDPDMEFTSLYGHLDPASLVPLGEIEAGSTLGILGDGGTGETDGERKHLHFSLHNSGEVNLLGYAQTENALEGWIDAEQFFRAL